MSTSCPSRDGPSIPDPGPTRAVVSRGQVVVETAIVMSILLPLALGASQIALLLAHNLAQTNATVTLAAVAAQDGPGAAFDDVVASESTRIRCEAPDVVMTTESSIVVVDLTCTWRAPVWRDATWTVSTSASAALAPEPTPEPVP